MTKESNNMVVEFFVSNVYGAQEFVAFKAGKDVAISGNIQSNKAGISGTRQVRLKDVKSRIKALKLAGVKVIDAMQASYSDLESIKKELDN